MRYFTGVDGDDQVVELTAEGVSLAGELVDAELATLPDGGRRHLRLRDRGYRFSAEPVDGGWEIRIEGHVIRVRVEDERTRRIRELAGKESTAEAGGRVLAPMPGRVLRILVEEGQRVEPGTALLTMEAMKMENELRAERGGRVAAIQVGEGDTVNQDSVLITLEASADGGQEGDGA